MVDAAIITVLDKENRELGDFELPVKIPIKELEKKLTAFLKAMEDDRFLMVRNVKIVYQDHMLQENSTLYQNGIWDGSVIKLKY